MQGKNNLQKKQFETSKKTNSLKAFIEVYQENREELKSSYNRKLILKRIQNGTTRIEKDCVQEFDKCPIQTDEKRNK